MCIYVCRVNKCEFFFPFCLCIVHICMTCMYSLLLFFVLVSKIIGVDHSIVEYRNVTIPASYILGKRGMGFAIAQDRLGPGRIYHCMRWIGQCQRAFDLMCERLLERKVRGGSHLGSKQLMQQHVFDSYCDINCLRLLTLSAAEKLDAGGQARVELSAAKAWGKNEIKCE